MHGMTMNIHDVASITVVDRRLADPGDSGYPDGLRATTVTFRDKNDEKILAVTAFGLEFADAPAIIEEGDDLLADELNKKETDS